jgi:uncharacterized membrane-anchored protein YhcB (DUF1043 family)
VTAAQWSDLTVAAAFVAGLIVGAVLVLRLAKLALELMRRERDRDL